MLRAEVRALADNLKDAENRAGLQVSLCEHTLPAAELVALDIQLQLSHACHLPPKPFIRACLINKCLYSHVFVAICAATAVLTAC